MADDAAETLRRVPLLSGLKGRELSRLAQRFRARNVGAGEQILVEGQDGVGFFVIAYGQATVTVQERPVSFLGPGDYFGEIALIDDGPRSATVTADTDLRCLGITPWDFKPFVREHPDVAWSLLVVMARRLRDAESRDL